MWGKSFCTNKMINFAAFKGIPETLIFISQMKKKGGETRIIQSLK